MKKYLSIFNKHTLIAIGISALSSYICLHFRLSLFVDFLILGLIIVFPLTFSLKEAFKRRERALQSLSLLKASLQSVYYAVQNTKLEHSKKMEFKALANTILERLIEYLLQKSKNVHEEDSESVQRLFHSVFAFIKANRKSLGRSFVLKIYIFLFRVNESIEFLLATKRHHTPWGIRAIILFAIYAFIIIYPASLLQDTGFEVEWFYVFVMTFFKGLILISIYNVQSLLEDPFNPKSVDSIRLDDFRFSSALVDIDESPVVPIMHNRAG